MATHQLAAIMFTDIVGYTALMGESEQEALHILDLNRNLQKPLVERYGGNYLKETGDGILASFDSASDAVYCAGAIQHAAREVPNLSLRIGIHLGDVVFKDNDVFGDGVNIASRIEKIADSGGIAISEPVHRNVKNKEGIQTEFLTEELLKNVEEPVRIFRAFVEESVQDPVAVTATSEKTTPSGLNRKLIIPIVGLLVILFGFLLYQKFWFGSNEEPGAIGSASNYNSIAVLPFADLSPEGDQEYLGDGIAEEIINVLTRIDGLKVIGRTSSFSFKDQNTDLPTIGNKLGVATILEGSVRKSNNQIRVTAQLIDAKDGSHIWSETYERELEDIFAIQDDISGWIVDKFQLTLTLSREESPPTRNIDAYEMYLRGRQSFAKGLVGTKTGVDYLEKAITLDPSFLQVYSILSGAY